MRGFLGGVLALVACLVLPLALVAVWLSAVVDDTDRYVGTVGPLATDPAVVSAAEESLTARTLGLLTDRGGDLGAAVAEQIEGAVATGVSTVVRSEQFRPAWEAANTETHRQLLDELRSSGSGGDVTLDLGAVLDGVIEEVGGSLPVELGPAGVEAPVTVLSGAQVEQARTAYAALSAAGLILPAVWVVLTLLALVLARRRSGVLALLGLGSVVTLLLGRLALSRLRDDAVTLVAAPDRDLTAAVWDGVTSDLVTATYVTAGIALVVGLVGVLGGLVGGRRRL